MVRMLLSCNFFLWNQVKIFWFKRRRFVVVIHWKEARLSFESYQSILGIFKISLLFWAKIILLYLPTFHVSHKFITHLNLLGIQVFICISLKFSLILRSFEEAVWPVLWQCAHINCSVVRIMVKYYLMVECALC